MSGLTRQASVECGICAEIRAFWPNACKRLYSCNPWNRGAKETSGSVVNANRVPQTEYIRRRLSVKRALKVAQCPDGVSTGKEKGKKDVIEEDEDEEEEEEEEEVITTLIPVCNDTRSCYKHE